MSNIEEPEYDLVLDFEPPKTEADPHATDPKPGSSTSGKVLTGSKLKSGVDPNNYREMTNAVSAPRTVTTGSSLW
jgi:hypothetical protein